MMLHTLVLSAAPLLQAPAQDPIELRFDPPVGSALTITATESHDLLMESLLTTRGGGKAIPANIDLRLRSRLETVIADLHADDAGRLRRRYMDLSGRLEMVDPDSVNEATGEWKGDVLELSSPFKDLSVAFQPAASQPGGFGRHFDGRTLRESFLPVLEAPFDWGRFLALPAGRASRAVTLGDRWELPPEVLQPLLAPSGFLAWRGEEDADAQILRAFDCGVAGNMYIGFDGDVSGKVEAQVKEIGGDSPEALFVELEIAVDVTLRSDRSSFIKENRIEAETVEQVQTLGARLSVRVKGGVRLRWSVADQVPLGAFALCDEVAELAVQILPPEGEQVEQRIRLAGGLANQLTFRQSPLEAPMRTEGR